MSRKSIFFLLFCFVSVGCFPCLAKEWRRAYLVSYPQSGNHWARYLIEEASHIATSSVYRDPEPPKHMNKIFPWGGYCCDHGYEGQCRYPTKEEIVLLKTHFPYPRKLSKFDQRPYEVAIRIVRHPVDSFYSRYEKLPKGPLQDKVPTERVRDLIKSWRQMQTYWNHKKNVITIRYEDMLDNPAVELKKMLKALHYHVTDEDIQRAVSKHPPKGYLFKHLSKFHEQDLKLIAEELSDLLIQYGYTIP